MNGSVRRVGQRQLGVPVRPGPDPLTGAPAPTKSGFATKTRGHSGAADGHHGHERGRSVAPSARTVGDFLDEWHAVGPGRRPAHDMGELPRLHDAYVIPLIGDTRLQDLTPVRLNLLYGHLLTSGRVKGPGGLAPKTVQNVHRMLHRALSDAVKMGLIPRNSAEDAQPPRVAGRGRRSGRRSSSARSSQHVRNDRFYALWLLVATTGLPPRRARRAAAPDVDLDHGRVVPERAPRRRGRSGPGVRDQDRAAGIRSLALDPRHRRRPARRTSTRGARSGSCSARTTELLFVWPDGRPLHPDTITALFHRHCRGWPTPDPAARRAALLRDCGPQGGGPAEGDQRAAGARHRGIHAADLHPRHPWHGRGGREQRRRPDPGAGTAADEPDDAFRYARSAE